MSRSIFIVAVEDSADVLGAELIQELRAADPDVAVSGVGGAAMRKLGVSSPVELAGLAILGLFDGFRAFGRVKRLVREIADLLERDPPDAVVLIDSWGFMWRLAREIKRRGLATRVVKLIGPQVWATRPGRARVLARWCDHLLCIHGFETPFYEGTGLKVTVVGNPAVGRAAKGDRDGYRRTHGFDEQRVVVGLLLGSRRAELKRVGPVLIEAAAALSESEPNVSVLCLPAPTLREEVLAMAEGWRFPHVLASPGEAPADVMAAMDIALACSGTVTTELAEQGVAVVTGYRLGWLSYLVVRGFLLRTRFISLVNVAAGREVIPEFVQGRLNRSEVTAAARSLCRDGSARQSQVSRQDGALRVLAHGDEGSAARRSAVAILSDLAGS